MGKLIKFLKLAPFLLLPTFVSNNVKAQEIYTPTENLPLRHIPKNFKDYLNREDIDTLLVDTTNLSEVNEFKSEALYLGFSKDSTFYVIELFGLKGNKYQGYEKTPAPWKYIFMKEGVNEGKEETYYDVWLDFFIDGPNGNEIREETWKEIELERRKNKPSINLYDPQRKVDI